MKLGEFYEKLVTSMGLKLNEQKQLFVNSERSGNLPLLIDGKPVYLPTKENVKNCIDIVDGRSVLKYHLFHPLQESAIKGENKSFMKFKDFIERNINYTFAVLGEVLFNILADNDIEITDVTMLELIDMLNEYKAPGLKKLIDENTVKVWVDLYKKIMLMDSHELFIHYYVKRGGKIGDKRYNRVGVISYPVLETLLPANVKKEKPYNIKFRNKDINAIKVYHEFTFKKGVDELIEGIQFGSTNKIAPGTITLLTIYDWTKEMINSAIDVIKTADVDTDLLEEIKLPDLPWTVEEIEQIIDSLKIEIKEIPTEEELLLSGPKQEEPANVIQNNNQPAVQQVNQAVTNNTSTSSEDEVLKKILGGSTVQQTPVTQPVSTFGNTGFTNNTMTNTGFGGFGNNTSMTGFGNAGFGATTGTGFGNTGFGNTGFGNSGFGSAGPTVTQVNTGFGSTGGFNTGGLF